MPEGGGMDSEKVKCETTRYHRLDLRIEWYKGGVRLQKTDAHVYTEGRASGPPRLLYIDDVGVLDRGNYSCHAYTKIGDVISEDWGHGYLRIKGQKKFIYLGSGQNFLRT